MLAVRHRSLVLLSSCLVLGSACTTPAHPRAAGLVAPAVSVRATQSSSAGPADAGGADLAKQLSNPVADLISVPFQLNHDTNIGPGDDGDRWTLNIQPVVPIGLSRDWNLISRTILPVIEQRDVLASDKSQSGLGDLLQSFFFSPTAPTAGGWLWGAGPVFLLPTATDDPLGPDQWAAGPTAVVLKQDGPWTYGALANHLWKVAGSDDFEDIDQTFLQPFASYTTPAAWTYTVNSESTYDWKESDWAVPLNAVVSKLTVFGTQPVSVFGGLRYWLESPDGGPEDFGLRLGVTFLFPK